MAAFKDFTIDDASGQKPKPKPKKKPKEEEKAKQKPKEDKAPKQETRAAPSAPQPSSGNLSLHAGILCEMINLLLCLNWWYWHSLLRASLTKGFC